MKKLPMQQMYRQGWTKMKLHEVKSQQLHKYGAKGEYKHKYAATVLAPVDGVFLNS